MSGLFNDDESSIISWLDSQPAHPDDYTHRETVKERAGNRKHSKDRPRHLKRHKLGEVSPNKRMTPRRSARNKPAEDNAEPPSTPRSRAIDQDVTPRPVRSQSSMSSRSTVSFESGARSPVKHSSDFQLSNMPVKFETFFLANLGQLPSEAQSLIKDLKRIGKGRAVIPNAVQLPSSEDILDHDVDRVLELCQLSARCQKSDVPEPEWNCQVHATALRLGLSDRVQHHNVSTARIRDVSLLPSTVTKSLKVKSMQSKMIDFAFFVQPDDALVDRIRSKLIRTGMTSTNFLDAGYIRFEPIGAIVETKRGAICEDEAMTQLCMCACAHFARLRQLAGNVDMPVLPLVRVQGPAWIFLLAVPQAERVVIFQDLPIGSTGSVLEAYAVIAAVRRLAQWTDEVFRPWFERACLGE